MTNSEENYLKVIFHLSQGKNIEVSTNQIANQIKAKPSSVTDMLKKLAEKKLLFYQKYQGVFLTTQGLIRAKMIIRKHRLWEVFLVRKLHFNWDEVHEIAEELEHIRSEKLINHLEEYLGFPKVDPHGDPIPDRSGIIEPTEKLLLSDMEVEFDRPYMCVGVKNSSKEYLQYLDRLNINIGAKIVVLSKEAFDYSLKIEVNGKQHGISALASKNLYIKKV